MFAVEVENIDGKANVFEVYIVLDNLREHAVIVVEYVLWLDVIRMEYTFNHFLDHS